MNKKELATKFGSDQNQKMLFKLIEKSQIDLNNKEIMEILENIYEEIINLILGDKLTNIMDINKLFIKKAVNETRNIYSKDFFKNKIDRKKESMDEIDQRLLEHKNNMESFTKNIPDQIDFTETNWRDKSILDNNVKNKIKEREKDLEKIASTYNKMENVEDFKNDFKWLQKKGVKGNKNKIMIGKNKINLNVEEINLKKKKVKFKDEVEDDLESEKWKKKIIFLEKEVSEIKMLIKEVLENSKDNKKKISRMT
jgi:hypothetical protein